MDPTRRTILTGAPLAAFGVLVAPSASAAPLSLAQRVYNRTLTMRGRKYVLGGESLAEGGFDCSGLIQWAYRVETGHVLPRLSRHQVSSPKLLVLARLIPIASAKYRVRPLQVVFFHYANGGIGHVAIATGGDGFFGGNYFSAEARELTYYVAANGVNSSTFTRYAGINKTFFSVKDRTSKPYTHVTTARWIEPAATTRPPAGSVTKRVKAGVTLNVRAGASTGTRAVGKVTGGTALTGVVSGGWMRITSGTFAGRYVSATYLV